MRDMERDLRDMMQRRADGQPAPVAEARLIRRAYLRRARTALGGLAAVAVLGAGGFVGAASLLGDKALPPAQPGPEATKLLGTWVGGDTDGSTQTMVVRASAEDTLEIVINDDSASVCSGLPSTTEGDGRLEDATTLVIPAPVLECDDGSEPRVASGPPLEEQLRNLTFIHDPETDTLTDNFETVWGRDGLPVSRTMWPQSTLEEVRQAQERADAGDPDYTWQVDAQLAAHKGVYGAKIFSRFLKEKLGWEEFRAAPFVGYGYNEGSRGDIQGVPFVRCAPGQTNPLYPDDPEGRGCAPTIDELHYETVAIDVKQLAGDGPTGIWVVTGWTMPPPDDTPITPASDLYGRQVAQVAPPTNEEVNAVLEGFLQARVAGGGAAEFMHTPEEEVPLLYATSSGEPYERSQIGRLAGPFWPTGQLSVRVRLYPAGGDTEVIQPFSIYRDESGHLAVEYFGEGTTENGKSVPEPSSILRGQVTYSAPAGWQEISALQEFGYLQSSLDGTPAVMKILPNSLLANDCDNDGTAAPSAEDLARALRSNPALDTTPPISARIGGAEALRLDVTVARGATTCSGNLVPVAPSPYGEMSGSVGPDEMARIYFVDLPTPLDPPPGQETTEPVRTLTILIQAGGSAGVSQDVFERIVESATPILESFEFHAD